MRIICFAIAYLLTAPASAEVDYASVKRNLAPDYISEMDFFISMSDAARKRRATGEEILEIEPTDLSNLAMNVVDGEMVGAIGSLPLTSCGGLIGYELYFDEDRAPTPEDGLRQAATAVLEVEGTLEAYGVEEAVWRVSLTEMEDRLKSTLPYAGTAEDRIVRMLEIMSDFSLQLSEVESSRYGPITLSATHNCGGGIYSVPVYVEPEGDHVELISAIYYDDCQNRGLPPRCNPQGVIDVFSPGDEFGLSGIYYYRVNEDSEGYKVINVNKRKRGVLSLIGSAYAAEFGALSSMALCFKNGVLQEPCEPW